MTPKRTISINRSSWLGHRWQQHGLGEECDGTDLDDLLLLGMQGSRQSAGEYPLSQRITRIGNTSLATAIGLGGPLVSIWSLRGAPHAHRASQLDLIRDALAPVASDDGGQQYVEAVDEVATALKQVVNEATTKAHASAETACQVSPSLVQWCQRCEANHVPDGIFRAAGRQAQLVIGPSEDGSAATTLHPRPKTTQITSDHPKLTLLHAYLRINGPTKDSVS